MKKPLSILPKISGFITCPSEVCSEYKTSVGKRGGQGAPPRELSMFETGLVNPLVEVGDIGTPLTSPEPDGLLERRSVVRRRCGVAPVYKSRVVIGDEGCGRAGERESGASPGDAILCEKFIIILSTKSMVYHGT
jgi:hypothetical protein